MAKRTRDLSLLLVGAIARANDDQLAWTDHLAPTTSTVSAPRFSYPAHMYDDSGPGFAIPSLAGISDGDND